MKTIQKHSATEIIIKGGTVPVPDKIILKQDLISERRGRVESIENLTNQIATKQQEILDLQARIVEIDEDLQEAESLGVKTQSEIEAEEAARIAEEARIEDERLAEEARLAAEESGEAPKAAKPKKK